MFRLRTSQAIAVANKKGLRCGLVLALSFSATVPVKAQVNVERAKKYRAIKAHRRDRGPFHHCPLFVALSNLLSSKLRLIQFQCCSGSRIPCSHRDIGSSCEAIMSSFEKLLAPGSTELPDCRCGAEMHLFAAKPCGHETEIRIFRCEICHHEFQLMVWKPNETQV